VVLDSVMQGKVPARQSIPDLPSITMLLSVVLIWAGSFIFIKIGLREIPPITLALLRFAVAFPILAIISLTDKKKKKVKIAWRKNFYSFTALALTGSTLLYIFQFYSLKFLTAAAGAIIINTTVIFMALLSVAFLKESLNKKMFLGILLAFSGVFMVMSGGSLGFFRFEPLEFIGGILMILSAFCWAVYSVLSKKVLQVYSPLTTNAIVFGLGTLYLVPLSLTESPLEALLHASWLSWLSVLYLAILSSALAYVLWSKALARLDMAKVGVFLYGIPALTMILSSTFLGEAITPIEISGLTLVISGVYLTETG